LKRINSFSNQLTEGRIDFISHLLSIRTTIPQLDFTIVCVIVVCSRRTVMGQLGRFDLEFQNSTANSRTVLANGVFGIRQEVGQRGFSTLRHIGGKMVYAQQKSNNFNSAMCIHTRTENLAQIVL
jgi:hypothetical protein